MEEHVSGGHSDAPHEELSAAPVLVALGTLVLYLSMEYKSLRLWAIPIFLLPFLLWVVEDVKQWTNRRVDHGVRPGRDLGWWGMVFFLGTEVMLFGGLFAAFFAARASNPDIWIQAREHLSHAVPLVTINTLILVTSGFTFHAGLHAIRKNSRTGFAFGMFATLALGATFLALQASEYMSLIEAGITLDSGSFGSIFYLLTGTHGFHVFLGLVFIGVLIARGALGQFDAERHVAVDTFGIYWHFVDVVWIMLYLVVYIGVI